MRQSSFVTPEADFRQASDPDRQVLHPVLAAALDSLDVELEEELTRYRRQKHRMTRQAGYKQHIPVWKPNGRGRLEGRSAAIDLPRLSNSIHSPQTLLNAQSWTSTQISSTQISSTQTSQEQGEPIQRQTHPVEDVWADASPTHPQPSRQEISSAASAGKLAVPLAISQERSNSKSEQPPDRQPDQPDQQPSDLGELSAAQLLKLSSETVHADTHSEPFFPDTDYLQSSEALLQSIAEETPNVEFEQESSLLHSLLSPLGVGSMLLLLLSSATLGYVIMHPSSLDFLTSQTQPSEAPVATSRSPRSSGSVPNSPNLAADEFIDLNVDTLSTLPGTTRQPTPSPSALPANGASSFPGAIVPPQTSLSESPTLGSQPNPASSAPVYEPPVYEPSVPSVPVPPENTVSVAPMPINESSYEPSTAIDYPPQSTPSNTLPLDAPVSAAPSPSTSPTETYYYVVTPYSGDPSLDNAREAVPDAYVRNFEAGASVQLGAFSDSARAEELIQQLESQGIPAEIYRP